MEALILAGGKAERLGDAAQGRPKPLVLVAGRPLVAYQVARLAEAGVSRVVVGCALRASRRCSRRSSPGSGRRSSRSASRSRSDGEAGCVSQLRIEARGGRCSR